MITAANATNNATPMKYIVNEPLVFLYNCSIIFFTLTLALLMRKRVFGYGIISFPWIVGDFKNNMITAANATNNATPMNTICHTDRKSVV